MTLAKVNNTEILDDPQLRTECGIECEAYDRALLEHVDIWVDGLNAGDPVAPKSITNTNIIDATPTATGTPATATPTSTPTPTQTPTPTP